MSLTRAVAPVAAALALSGCAALGPARTDVPVGGVRAEIVTDNRAAAREKFPGGLLEPAWLPEGFELVQLEYAGGGRHVDSVDQAYMAGELYVHIWQTVAELPPEADPLSGGQPVDIAGVTWHVERPDPGDVGRAGVIVLNARLEDGRTVSVDGNLSEDSMRRVVESLVLVGGGPDNPD